MPRQNFTWSPDLGAQRSVKPNVHQTKFGDGYEVRVANGINTSPKKWTLRFSRDLTEATAILTFIENHAGATAFNWTDTLNTAGVYVCREWTINQKFFGVYEVQATFEQVYEA